MLQEFGSDKLTAIRYWASNRGSWLPLLGTYNSTRSGRQSGDWVREAFARLELFKHTANPISSVIAVTGLAGHAYGSWKRRGGQFMWLRDRLPRDLPEARILIFGFDSTLTDPCCSPSISDFASKLLHAIRDSRIAIRVYLSCNVYDINL